MRKPSYADRVETGRKWLKRCDDQAKNTFVRNVIHPMSHITLVYHEYHEILNHVPILDFDHGVVTTI